MGFAAPADHWVRLKKKQKKELITKTLLENLKNGSWKWQWIKL